MLCGADSVTVSSAQEVFLYQVSVAFSLHKDGISDSPACLERSTKPLPLSQGDLLVSSVTHLHYNWAAFIPRHHPAHCSSSVSTALRRNPCAPQRTGGVRTDPRTDFTNLVLYLVTHTPDSRCVVRVNGDLPTCCVSL